MLLECDKDGRILWMSDKARERLGPAVNVLEAFAEDLREQVRQFLCGCNPAESLAGLFHRGGERGPVPVRLWRVLRVGNRVVLSAEVRERSSDEEQAAVQPLISIEQRTLRNYFRLLAAQQALDSRKGRGRKRPSAPFIKQLERERARMGRKLHTGVGQSLAGIKLHLDIINRVAAELPKQVENSLERIARLAADAQAEVRSVSRALHPPDWQNLNLEQALRNLWDNSGFAQSFQGNLVLGPIDREPPFPVRVVVYRVAQEALANVVQHAGASQIHMSLSQRNNRLVLAVEDNGKGFDTRNPVPSPGIGLRTIREQVHALKGDLHLTSDENGTKLEISVPLEIRDDEA
jgi:signal transduction histidine kinase